MLNSRPARGESKGSLDTHSRMLIAVHVWIFMGYKNLVTTENPLKWD